MKRTIGLLLIGIILTGCATTKVNINTNVEGARIIVDGKEIGQTPIKSAVIKNVTGRQYKVFIEKEGYKTFQGTLQKEDNIGAMVAVYIGYSFCWLILPALLLINLKYFEKPVSDQYFVLEKDN